MAMLAVKASWGKLWWGVLAGLALLFLIALKTVPGAPPEPLYFVPGNPGKVAFTFEALWGTEGLEEILAVLKREGVHCTFFVTGPWVTRHPESAKAIIGDAHELGNHGCSHRSLLYADEEEITREIREFNRITEALLEYRAPVFRPPYGAYNGLILAKAHREGQRTVLWSLDSRDWISASGEEIQVRFKERLQDGAIVLFRVGAPELPGILPELIKFARERGYEPVKVSQLLDRS
ncbi:MAG: polysaccharide deacetylase family protein [Firmicutes bacterium]|nr:polysaccharide deacetylase family protein [Bacillota bacterium]